MTSHWLQSVEPCRNGDATGDGKVTLADFQRFKHELFLGDPATLNAARVPEPASLRLGFAAATMLLCFRQRRRQFPVQ